MRRDFFFYPEAKRIVGELDIVARSTTSRGSVFADWLSMICSSLTGGRDEENYLSVVRRYANDGEPIGNRPCDRLARCWGMAVSWYEQNPKGDILGDIFQGGITYGENGQYFTPEFVCDLMASMSAHDTEPRPDGSPPRRTMDPACGSGRMLLAFAKKNPGWEYFAQDIDMRCVCMVSINLALAGLRGYAFCGNALDDRDRRGGYAIGWDGIGMLRRITAEEHQGLIRAAEANFPPAPPPPQADAPDSAPAPPVSIRPMVQMSLFE